MTIKDLKANNLIVLECISGSKAYGLDTPSSDTDIKGVFVLPKKDFYGLNYIPQISNETNDIVYFELGRFMELLSVNNPNILELLNTPQASILYKHPFLNGIESKFILSKLCKNTFGKFAISQIKKAKGLNKKIVNPIDKKRKSVLDFCYVTRKQGSASLRRYLNEKNWKQEDCGLVKIPNMKDVYGFYYDPNANYKGILKTDTSNSVSLSAVPENRMPDEILYFNQNGYSTYCKDYKEYWDWVEKRNESRYENTLSHGKNYDSKNMMHTFRLLEMAIEIARDHEIKVKRHDRQFLLNIKSGTFEYDELIKLADEKQKEMEAAFASSSLPDRPNIKKIKEMTFALREQFYAQSI